MSKKSISGKVKGSAGKQAVGHYVLQLFVTGLSPNSIRAIVNLRKICKEYLKDEYELEIIDITLKPQLAVKEQILVIPVLIKKFPLPEMRMIGDLSNKGKVLEGLGLL